MSEDSDRDVSLPDFTPDGENIARQVKRIKHENRALFARLIEGEKRFRSLAKAVWMVQEDERRGLARELHDGIGQTLTALKNQLERQSLKCKDEKLKAGLQDSVELAKMVLNDTRELSRLLRPAVLDDLGLDAALRWLSRTLGKRAELNIEVDCDLGDTRLESDVETLVFRFVQEALTNIIKHAGTEHVEVNVSYKNNLLRVSVVDEGEGFEPHVALQSISGGESLGLRGMRDRVELFGGAFTITSSPGNGCAVEAAVPINLSVESAGAS